MKPEGGNVTIFFLLWTWSLKKFLTFFMVCFCLSLWCAPVRGDMFGLQMINYGTICFSMALGDHFSATLYSSFSGESSGPKSGILELPSMEDYLGFCCPLPWSLRISSMLVHALKTFSISEHLLKETNGIAEAWYFQADQRDHISKESGHDIGLNFFWGFENFISVTCISQLQEIIYNDILWLGLMLNNPFVVLLINWEKWAGFEYNFLILWYIFKISYMDYIREITNS